MRHLTRFTSSHCTALLLLLLSAFPAALAQTVQLPPEFVLTFATQGQSNVIAFNPTDGMIYRAVDVPVKFEKVDPVTKVVTPIATLGNSPIIGMVWYPPLNVFVATTLNDDVLHITPAGTFTVVGNMGVDLRGLAVVMNRVYAVSPNDGNLYEINPATGAIVNMTPVLLDGVPLVQGQSLTTDPVTGQVYAVLRRTGGGAQDRILALLNVNAATATKLVDLPDAFTTITFANGTLYGATGNGAAVPHTLYRFTIINRPLANPAVSDQKAGSVLVFPYYTSAADGNFAKSDTLLTITNACDGKAVAGGAPNYSFLHLFFLNGCSPADTYVCLTPGGSIQIKASDYDPTVTGYLVAVAVDMNGAPINQNCFLGSAFVRDDAGSVIDSYGAEAFAALLPNPGVPNGGGNLVRLDGFFYDAAPTQFSVQLQDPSKSDEILVLASVSGDLGTGLRATAQSGVGILYRADEYPASFQPQLSSACLSVTAVDKSKLRVVPGTLDSFLKDSYGYAKFNVSIPAVGLLLSKQGPAGQATNRWSGIRTLHKTGVTAAGGAAMLMPMFSPFCGF